MKKLIFTVTLIFSGLAYSAPQEVTLIIKYPYHAMSVPDPAAKISINGAESFLIDTKNGAGDTSTTIVKVPAGVVTIESAHWNLEGANYINKIEAQGGKTYTVVLYMMMLQMWDMTFSTMQNMLTKNLEPEKSSYRNFTIKNQVISIK